MAVPDARIAAASEPASRPRPDLATLRRIEDRVRWLSTAMIHHANRVRANPSGVKVGGHQASCASMTTIMSTLWFHALAADDRVSVKPHASPVLHAVNHLLGELPERYMTTLRALGGLQSYPSRTKDPDPVDYSTGSVGLGATAPIWGALARRYVRARFGTGGAGRQWALIGDAELDEGACWEAIADPTVPELSELVWVVDVNRQSLDRVVPGVAVPRLERMLSAAGWQVITVKYGTRLSAAFQRPGGDALRHRIDAMPNAEYQRLVRCAPAEVRDSLAGRGPDRAAITSALDGHDDAEVATLVRDLGGHDMTCLLDAYDTIDDDRPTAILAYTIKGYGLPVAGHPANHSALLSDAEFQGLAAELGMDPDAPWRTFPDDTAEGRLCAATARRLHRTESVARPVPALPTDLGKEHRGHGSTQAALGRILLDVTRDAPGIAERVVTVSADVASTTNLGGWVNKVGVWAPGERHDWFSGDRDTVLHWQEGPAGRHIELGIAETNLVGLLGELGATWSRWGEPLIPIGVLYDPFVGRALEPWSFGMYAGGQSILVGTPSGVSLAPEGGAHQSVITPSIGLEQPGCVAYEPAFAQDLEWCLLAAMARLGHSGGHSTYLRLSTRPVDQALAGLPGDPGPREARRRAVVNGGYRLRPRDDAAVVIAALGASVVEALDAADRLDRLGVPTEVVCVTSPGLLFEATRAARGHGGGDAGILDELFPKPCPVVTVVDGHPHTLAFLSGVRNVPVTTLGVTAFGQSGELAEVHRLHGIDAESIVMAALDLTDA